MEIVENPDYQGYAGRRGGWYVKNRDTGELATGWYHFPTREAAQEWVDERSASGDFAPMGSRERQTRHLRFFRPVYDASTLPDNPRPLGEMGGREVSSGVFEMSGEQVIENAQELAGRIDFQTQRDDGRWGFTWDAVDSMSPYDNPPWGRASTVDGTTPDGYEYGGGVVADRLYRVKLRGARTDEDEFYDMRAAVGGESEEPIASLADRAHRFIGKYEVYVPEVGWSPLRHIQVDDEDREYEALVEAAEQMGVEEPWGPMLLGVDGGTWMRFPPRNWYGPVDRWADPPDYGSIRIRPIS